MKVLLAALAVLALLPAAARAQDSDALSRSVVGFGAITANSSPTHPAPACASSASTPESRQVDCGAIAAASFGNCPPPGGGPGNCRITLTATPGSPGWEFQGWSGGKCAGTGVCSFITEERICDLPGGECRLHLTGPYTVVATFKDVRDPTVGALGGPAENSVVVDDARRASFTFNTNEDDEAPSFQCRLDGGAFTTCASPRTVEGLTDGVHDFCVRAFDASGHASTNAPCRHWEQQTKPTAAIVTHPGAVSGSAGAAFTYTSNKTARVSFECALDGAAFAPCAADGARFDGLADGAHRFAVRAVFRGALDGPAVRRVDPSPATRGFSLAVLVPAPIDRDHDGYVAALDCDDGNAAINPGAREIPGNAIDEDCDGVAAEFPRILAQVTNAGKAGAKQTVFTRFLITEIPAGATVELRCSAPRRKACPFARRSLHVAKGSANGLVTRSERRRGLAIGVGATVDARIVAEQMIGRVRRFKITKNVYPTGKTLCLAPGSTRPGACPDA